jgi:hypothetical protein
MPWKRCLTCAAAALLSAACGAPPRQPEPALVPPSEAAAPLPPPGAPAYRVDPAASELRLEVYRDGPLARLGHDHVIENHELSGWGVLARAGEPVRFYLEIPVADFVIDDPVARAAAGPGFEDDVSADAKAGTRVNMLGARLLDAAQYPSIRISGGTSRDAFEAGTLGSVDVRIAGRDAAVSVPISVSAGADSVSVSADFPLQQSALGFTPFSVMMGALQVRDEFHVRLRIVARRSVEPARQQ